ncbi:MAG TPA: ABC transporter ATP-binding protein [Bryobacteraceae bacterium]|nr:ABC transporter ATP-binding protein [Bryobacteraceae bacterium]
MPNALLAVEHASVWFGSGSNRVRALEDVSLDFAPATLTVVMGPSGSGKTTLLSLLGCLLNPDSGKVFVQGTDAAAITPKERSALRRREIGFVFQAFRLFHSLSALQNVALKSDIAGETDSDAWSMARDLLVRLGLTGKLNLKPDALSGGEKQRVAIARALISNPKILLADEPTASLDSTAGRQICEILRGLATEEKRTVVVVSHDPRWTAFADRTVTLADGRILEEQEQSK